MRARVISQYAGEDSHYSRLAEILREDTGYEQIRILCAFVTMGGLTAIEGELRGFLTRGGHINWIVGIDDVTTREALQYLRNLAGEFPEQVSAYAFSAGNSQHIFHPKVYWLLKRDAYKVIVGSANLTLGGLVQNFETSLELDLDLARNDEGTDVVVTQLENLWIQYSSPLPPMNEENLINLADMQLPEFINQVRGEEQNSAARQERAGRTHPLTSANRGAEIRHRINQLHVPRRTRARTENPVDNGEGTTAPEQVVRTASLIMDILQETRQTQVQIPLRVVQQFLNDANEIVLTYVPGDGREPVTHRRPIIRLNNDTARIEIDTIRGIQRPLIIRINQSEEPNAYWYELYFQGTHNNQVWDAVLSRDGIQSRAGARRWLIIPAHDGENG